MVRLVSSRRHFSGQMMCLNVTILRTGGDGDRKPRKKFKAKQASAKTKLALAQAVGTEPLPNQMNPRYLFKGKGKCHAE